MKRTLLRRITQALEEEEAHDIDPALLETLHRLAAEDTDYFELSPERRNTLNEWFAEVKDLLFQELLRGDYGVQILLDTFMVLCFEVGNRLGKEEA